MGVKMSKVGFVTVNIVLMLTLLLNENASKDLSMLPCVYLAQWF